MPIDDLIELSSETYDNVPGEIGTKKAVSRRKLIIYGTVFSQRDKCIIGKLDVEFTYSREIIEASSNRSPGVSISNDLYLQKEVFLNRKIPLNGYLSIDIGELSELKDSLDNIEYLISLYNDPDSRDNLKNRTMLNSIDGIKSKRTENIDRKRALMRMYKEGLNIGVTVSVFEESMVLKQRFGTHETGVVFKTLNPNFNNEHEYRIKMDTSIFEHLKYRSAVYEIRHYFVQDSNELLNLGRIDDSKSEANSEFLTEGRDYITLGYAKVPLVNLITKSNGVDQNVVVLDSFSQKLGYLKIKMSLNYQSRKKLQIYKEPAEKPQVGEYFLGFSFVELISQNNKYLECKGKGEEIKHLLFKFKWNDQTHQVRYIPDENVSRLPLNINVYNINKLCLIDFDIDDDVFTKPSTPIEIQMWTKIENKQEYMKDKDELIGSTFIDIHALLGQRRNSRLKNDSLETLNSHDGYYIMVNNETDTVRRDRLGFTTFVIRKEYEGHKEDLEKMFYVLFQHMRKEVLDDYDLNLKGTIDFPDLAKLIDKHFQNEREKEQAFKYFN